MTTITPEIAKAMESAIDEAKVLLREVDLDVSSHPFLWNNCEREHQCRI